MVQTQQRVGQRVQVRIITEYSGLAVYDGGGEVVAFVLAICEAEGFIEERSRIVVQCDDGRFRFCTPGDVTVLGDRLPQPAIREEMAAAMERVREGAQS